MAITVQLLSTEYVTR